MTFQNYAQTYLMIESNFSSIIDFEFKKGDNTFIEVSNNGVAYWVKERKRALGFSNTLLKTAISHLIENFHFNVGSVTIKQGIDIPKETDPALFRANL